MALLGFMLLVIIIADPLVLGTSNIIILLSSSALINENTLLKEGRDFFSQVFGLILGQTLY